MNRLKFLVLVVVTICLALPLQAQKQSGVRVVLKADTGNYAARCNNCIPKEAFPDNMAVHVMDPTKAFAQWFLIRLDNGNYALKSVDSGRYAARCNNCIPNAAFPDSVFVHADSPDAAFAQWKLEALSNGKYAFKSADSGRYAARCNNCAPGAAFPDNVFVHVTDVNSSPFAQWDIIIIP